MWSVVFAYSCGGVVASDPHFSSQGTDNEALDYALNRALDCWYNDKKWFRGLQRRVMQQDWSWSKPAIDYVELYYAAIKDVTGC